MMLQLQPQFGYVILAAAVLSIQCLLVGFLTAGRVRNTIFTEQFMKENFGAEHKKILGVDIKAGGYPDTGSGVYSRNLTYEQWFAFNNAQRAHMNFVEMFGPSVVFLVAGGIYYPIPAASIGLFLIISRIVYSCSYSMGGPQQRLIGAIMNDAALLALFILSFISGIRFILDEEI